MEREESSESVAWCWVIEALATSHLLDVSLLYELVAEKKELQLVLGEAAREALALRCLEDSLSFDLPQDFLLSALRQTTNTCGDVSQSNVLSFIKHKKSCFQPSTLHLLKNAILEGNAPLAASLKDISGLPQSNTAANLQHNAQAIDISRPCIDGRVVDAKLPSAVSPDKDVDNLEPAGKKIKLDRQCGVQSNPLPANDLVCQQNHQNSFEGTAAGRANLTQLPADKTGHHSAFTENFIMLTEPSLCMKCNKGGQLLACSATACPLLFHHTCLGCSVSYDDQGNYLCPICAYRRAVSEYARAKEKVSSARTELSLFIGGNTSVHSEL